jgi:uncharacterized protein YuzE
MRVRVDQAADAVYVNLTDRVIEESEEVADGIVVDYDAQGRIVGVEILDASKRTADDSVLKQFGLDFSPLRTSVMPFVESSMMSRVEYDEDTSELDITFKSGKTYRYREVPPDIYSDLLDAESNGEFFNEKIKDTFDFVEVVPSRSR